MPTTYGQFCPIAKAMEVLDERWMMLVLRELLLGSRHFNEVRRGVPRMSPTLLSKRLQTLVRAGVVQRHCEGKQVTYHLTPAGQELMPILEAIGRWGLRWMQELYDDDLDPYYLLWDIRRNIDLEMVPDTTTVLGFHFSDVDSRVRHWWMVIRREGVDVCDFDQGHDVWAHVHTTLRTLTRLWRGDFGWSETLRSGEVVIDGQPAARRTVPRWLGRSFLADTPRPGPPAPAAGADHPADAPLATGSRLDEFPGTRRTPPGSPGSTTARRRTRDGYDDQPHP